MNSQFEKGNETHFVKMTGKANIEKPLLLGNNYQLQVQGTITSLTESDGFDGGKVIYYKFEPIIVELITDKGESIKAKDTRSLSQLFRMKIWKETLTEPTGEEFDSIYKRLMMNMINHATEIYEMYGQE